MTNEETTRLAELNKLAKKLHWSQQSGPRLPTEPFKPEKEYLTSVKTLIAFHEYGYEDGHEYDEQPDLLITVEILEKMLKAKGQIFVSSDDDTIRIHDVTQKLTPTPKYKTRMREYKVQFEIYQKNMAAYKENLALWNEWWALSVKNRNESMLDKQLKEARELIQKVEAAKALLLIHGEKIV